MPVLPKNLPTDYNFFREDHGARAKNHEYIDGEYVERPYVFAEFPKMLYHPDWGKSLPPEMARFAAGASTVEQYQAALFSYNEAFSAWQRQNRTRVVANKKEEDNLAKKGWLLKPPVHQKADKGFDLNSDEL